MRTHVANLDEELVGILFTKEEVIFNSGALILN